MKNKENYWKNSKRYRNRTSDLFGEKIYERETNYGSQRREK